MYNQADKAEPQSKPEGTPTLREYLVDLEKTDPNRVVEMLLGICLVQL